MKIRDWEDVDAFKGWSENDILIVNSNQPEYTFRSYTCWSEGIGRIDLCHSDNIQKPILKKVILEWGNFDCDSVVQFCNSMVKELLGENGVK